MLWKVRTTRLRVPWRVAAADVLGHEQLPDGRFRWIVDLRDGSPILLRLLPGVLSVEPLAEVAGGSEDAAA